MGPGFQDRTYKVIYAEQSGGHHQAVIESRMGTDKFSYRDCYKTERMFEDCTETGKTVYAKLENHTENVEGGKERM